MQKTSAVMLCRQIHERLRRFEKRGLLPVGEHAAGLAADVSDPAASSDKKTTSSWRAERQSNAHSFRLSETFVALMFDSRYEFNELCQE